MEIKEQKWDKVLLPVSDFLTSMILTIDEQIITNWISGPASLMSVSRLQQIFFLLGNWEKKNQKI